MLYECGCIKILHQLVWRLIPLCLGAFSVVKQQRMRWFLSALVEGVNAACPMFLRTCLFSPDTETLQISPHTQTAANQQLAPAHSYQSEHTGLVNSNFCHNRIGGHMVVRSAYWWIVILAQVLLGDVGRQSDISSVRHEKQIKRKNTHKKTRNCLMPSPCSCLRHIILWLDILLLLQYNLLLINAAIIFLSPAHKRLPDCRDFIVTQRPWFPGTARGLSAVFSVSPSVL